MRKFYCIMLFGNIISTKLDWLICTFSSQLSTFCMLHVILHFHMGKGIHDPNDPLHFSCTLGFLGCEMCLFQKLYVEGFVYSFAAIVYHSVGLELTIVIVFLYHLIRITTQLPVHTLGFFSPSMFSWRRICFPTLVQSCTKYLWASTQNSACLFAALKH